MAYLGWRNGAGAVQLLERHGHACLLEDAGGETLRDHWRAHGDKACNQIIVRVLQELHRSSKEDTPAGLTPLRDHFRALLQPPKSDDRQLTDALIHCAATAEDLLAKQSDARPLHGDLHHDNIITGKSRGWLAIDPHGLMGDAAYEVANVFGNPTGAVADIVDPKRIVTCVRLFAACLGCSEKRVAHYAMAHAGLSICWSIEDGDGFGQGSNAAERLAFLNVMRRLIEGREFSP
jgi:streptomycin 6-kinase